MMKRTDHVRWTPLRWLTLITIGGALAALPGCGAQGPSDSVEDPDQAEFASCTGSGCSCPVTITVPSANQAVGPYIQISVSQACSSWTNSMTAYIDNVDCSSTSYFYPNDGCHTTGGAQNFAPDTWVQINAGTHSIHVNNWNATGDVGVSGSVTFTYTPSPAGITISSPTANATVTNPLTVAASATENVGINQMQVWADGTKLGYFTNSNTGATQMSMSQNFTLAGGAHTLTVLDQDSNFNTISRSQVSVTVAGIKITNPIGGTTVSSPVTINATANEAVGINQMQVWADGVKLGYVTNSNTSSTSMTLSQSYSLGQGAHTVTVLDEDNNFNVISSSKVSFTVGSSSTFDPVIAGAGDIARANGHMAGTASELQRVGRVANDYLPDYVFTAGDNVYGSYSTDQGSWDNYKSLYDPSWGIDLLKQRTLPTPGNHDFGNYNINSDFTDANNRILSGYYAYFTGQNAGYTTKALKVGGTTWDTLYYGYDIPTTGKPWRFISIDSGPCFPYSTYCSDTTTKQYQWLVNTELPADTKGSTGKYAGIIAVTHIQRFSIEKCGGGNAFMDAIYKALWDAKVDVIVQGHVHNTARFDRLARSAATTTQTGCANGSGPVYDSTGPIVLDLGSGGQVNGTSGLSDGISYPYPVTKFKSTTPGAIVKITLHPTSFDYELRNESNTLLDPASGYLTFNVR